MSKESQLQAKIAKYLRDNGCYVIVTTIVPGVPAGCPDIIFLCGGLWGAIEVKASEKSSYRPLQEETLDKLDSWSWARTVYPGNWRETKKELSYMI